ncbi:MAG: diaminopimelate epimerase [Nitrospirae bacterium]|nr:diaminopimelate epimerase [Nitrospirota bacterium]
MHFSKMHGLGNDFILIDCISQAFSLQSSAFSDLSKKLCHRRFGIGADQLLLLCTSAIADFRMRIFNADGSEVEMCGNGVRCLAKYIWDRGISQKSILDIETLAGIIRPEKKGDMVRVDMGEPVFEPEKIPIKVESSKLGVVLDYPLKIGDREFNITCVSMGNPHTVIAVDNLDDFPVTYYGPMIERHAAFPKKTNVEFIEVLNSSEIRMRVWERGAGETPACGTGASASAVASHIKRLTEKNVTIHLAGGDLYIEWSDNNHVYMTGPAVEVFTGEINQRGGISEGDEAFSKETFYKTY